MYGSDLALTDDQPFVPTETRQEMVTLHIYIKINFSSAINTRRPQILIKKG